MSTDVVMRGFPELIRKLNGLAQKGAQRAATGAIKKGMTVIARGMRSAAPTPGLRKSIGKRFKRKRKDGTVQAKVGIDVGKKRDQQVPEAHFVALGTKQRIRKRIGGKFAYLEARPGGPRSRRTGRMTANDFVGAGFAASASAATTRIITSLEAEIEREAHK
jgi:HK97 gp10 family phage protein